MFAVVAPALPAGAAEAQVPGPVPVPVPVSPYARGPEPTLAVLDAEVGPFAVGAMSIPNQWPWYAGGTVYAPFDTSQGRFGVIAVAPGHNADASDIAWIGRRVASHGFVVYTIDTLSPFFDMPNSRGLQLREALIHLTNHGPDWVKERMDTMRLGLAGHSLGAGGALEMARDEPFFEATVALQPWDHASFEGTQVPTLVVGAQDDTIAPVADMAEPFYESIPPETEKAYVELAGADHAVGLRPDVTQARLMVAWFKRYLDDDLRYDQFLCPPSAGPTITEHRHTCPA
jgi:dienelactone hydrolase